jgi:hypothetical protein
MVLDGNNMQMCIVHTTSYAARREYSTVFKDGYRAELFFHTSEYQMERAKGIEPSCVAWKATVLPLNYARDGWMASRAMMSYRPEKCNSELGRASGG